MSEISAMRKQRLLNPDGSPKCVRIWDNPEQTTRFIVQYTHASKFGYPGWAMFAAMSADLTVNIQESKPLSVFSPREKNIKFHDFPLKVRTMVLSDYYDYWKIPRG